MFWNKQRLPVLFEGVLEMDSVCFLSGRSTA